MSLASARAASCTSFAADRCSGIFRIDQCGKNLGPRRDLAEQFQPLRHHRGTERGDAGDVAAGPIEARDKAEADRILAQVERRPGSSRSPLRGDRAAAPSAVIHSPDGARGRLPAPGRRSMTSAKRYSMTTFWPSTKPASLRPWRTAVTLVASAATGCQEPDHRHRRLLRASHKRPRDRRAAEKRDNEFSPPDVNCHVDSPVGGRVDAMEMTISCFDRAVCGRYFTFADGVVSVRLPPILSVNADIPDTLQIKALKAAGCDIIRKEKASGTTTKGRAELAAILDFIRAGDMLVVTRIDRLARSIADLQDIVRTLCSKTRGAALRATEQPIDTTTAAGKCFLDMLGEPAARRSRLVERNKFVGKVESLWRYPVKTMRSEELQGLRWVFRCVWRPSFCLQEFGCTQGIPLPDRAGAGRDVRTARGGGHGRMCRWGQSSTLSRVDAENTLARTPQRSHCHCH